MKKSQLFLTLSAVPVLLMGCGNDLGVRNIENKPPIAQILSHSTGDEVREGYAVRITGNAKDSDRTPAEELEVRWFADDEEVCNQGADTEGNTSCNFIIPPPDAVRIRLEVEDEQGDLDFKTIDLTILPNTPPTVSLLTPVRDDPYYSNTPIVFSGIVGDAEDSLDELIIEWDSDVDGLLGQVSTAPNAQGHIEGEQTLSQGPHTITVTVTDLGGKIARDVENIQVGPPNNLPTCSWVAPEDGDISGQWHEVVLAAQVNDPDVPGNDLLVEFSSDRDGVLTVVPAGVNGDVQVAWDTLSLNTHELTIRVTDDVGAECTDTITHIVVEPPSAPTVHIEPPYPSASEDLVCIIDVEAVDPQGDPLTYIFSWRRDGVDFYDATMTHHPGDTVEFQHTAPGQDWECYVVATDGPTFGDPGRDTVTVDPPYAVQIETGRDHTCLIDNNNWLECWGDSSNQRLSLSGGSFTDVALGLGHTCGIDMLGFVQCVGINVQGQSDTSGLSGTFEKISAGDAFNCAIETGGGGMQCWGQNDSGQAPANVPVPVGASRWIDVTGGFRHTCAIDDNNDIQCWGTNAVNQLERPLGGTFIQVDAGTYHTCALDQSGTAHCWGQNNHGESNPPNDTFDHVSSGERYSCGVKGNGDIVCWGNLTGPQQNNDPPSGAFVQVTASNGSDREHTCALSDDPIQTPVCWGVNDNGEADAPDQWW